MAGVCSVNQFVKEPVAGGPIFYQEVIEKIKNSCKKNDVLDLTVWAPNQGKNTDGAGNSTNYVSKGVIFSVAAEKCNFKQTIMHNIEGGMYSLVCVLIWIN